MDRKQTSQITIGALMIVLGLIFLAARLSDRPDLYGLHRLWPVILIVFGLGNLLAPEEDDRHRRGRRSGGVWFLFLGGIFLLHTYGVLLISQSWPLFIVWAGFGMMLSHRRRDAPKRIEGDK